MFDSDCEDSCFCVCSSHTVKPVQEWPLSHNVKTMPTGHFPCESCGRTYKLRAYLLEHIDFAHPNERETVRMLEDSIKSITEVPDSVPSSSTDVTLEYVDPFGSGGPGPSEEVKLIGADPLRKYECSLCMKRYKTRTHLANHYKTHTGEYRNLSCPIEGCDHKVRGRAKLEAHMRMKHPESIPEEEQYRWQCENCGKFCISRDHLRKHSWIHMDPREREVKGGGPRKIPCTIEGCSVLVANRGNLEAHISSKHPETLPEEDRNRWKCDVCDKAFGAKKSLDRHKVTHSEADPQLACDQCGMSFKRRYVLNQHMARKHGQGGHPPLPEEDEGSAIVIMEVDTPESKVAIGTLGTMRRSTLRISSGPSAKNEDTIKVWKCKICQKYFSVNLSKEDHMSARHPQKY